MKVWYTDKYRESIWVYLCARFRHELFQLGIYTKNFVDNLDLVFNVGGVQTGNCKKQLK